MDHHAIRELLDEVKGGRLSRRAFIATMVGAGLTAPLASGLLGGAGIAHAQAKAPTFTPTKRGGGGPLKVLWWQAPTLLNPHFAVGTKDQDGSRIFYEPLAGFDPEGNLVPVLAAEIPSLQNGGVAKDGRSVTWRLKPNVAWHDGKPFSADDVVFNWEYAADTTTAAVTNGIYGSIDRIDKLDALTVRVTFKQPTPGWADAFCGRRGLIIPKHLFDAYRGGKSREAPANLKPVGTGPYRFVDFRPGDAVRAELNPNYHVPNRPFFDQLEMKGGGDAPSAARAVLQTGEFDFAWNLQVADDILKRLEQGGKGRVQLNNGGAVEHIQCNASDPWKDVDGERSSLKTSHPLLSDPAVRQALNMLVDRAGINEQIYGRLGQASANYLNGPPRFRSQNMRWEFNVEKAAQVLEAAGWKRGADGVRVKDGKRLKLAYQTSINAERQKTQQIVKQAAARAGVEVEIKSVVASVFFSSDVANPDTYTKFYSDIQMYNNSPDTPDPQSFMSQFTSWEAATKDNKWQGRNITRWRHEEYDRVWRAAASEMDPVKRAALFVKMNDLVIQHVVVIPVSFRNGASGAATKLGGTDVTAWDSNLWRLAYWHREA
ncbi:MAG: peptide ABC transporter substrate-binding protein [Candidatus Rokubacteria bacterium]|nr:peptide ABC transporter substrate-binding protein [Candidatus Rokubacteria bacterium]